MAEGLLLDVIQKRGLQDRIDVDAAGTAGYHAGSPADPRTLELLQRVGAPAPGLSRRVTVDDFSRFDWIVAMDASNYQTLLQRAPKRHAAQIVMALAPIGGGDVPDPYYGGLGGFDTVHQLLVAAIDEWLPIWLEQSHDPIS